MKYIKYFGDALPLVHVALEDLEDPVRRQVQHIPQKTVSLIRYSGSDSETLTLGPTGPLLPSCPCGPGGP